MTHQRVSSSLFRWALVVALGSNVFLSVRSIVIERRHALALRVGDSVLRTTREAERLLRLDRAALLTSIGDLPTYAPFIAGYAASDSRSINVEVPMDGVYYLLSPTCAACRQNLPFLDSLAATGTLKVLGFAREASLEQLQQYRKQERTNLEIIAEPRGYIEAITPRSVTPLSVIVFRGRVAAIVNGKLSERDKEELTRQATGVVAISADAKRIPKR